MLPCMNASLKTNVFKEYLTLKLGKNSVYLYTVFLDYRTEFYSIYFSPCSCTLCTCLGGLSRGVCLRCNIYMPLEVAAGGQKEIIALPSQVWILGVLTRCVWQQFVFVCRVFSCCLLPISAEFDI